MSAGQMFFKQASIFVNSNPQLNPIKQFLFNPWFYGAVSFFAISSFVWVKILSEMKISIAYPILSVSYILTAIGANYLFQEQLTPLNILGILLIMIGVTLISIK